MVILVNGAIEYRSETALVSIECVRYPQSMSVPMYGEIFTKLSAKQRISQIQVHVTIKYH